VIVVTYKEGNDIVVTTPTTTTTTTTTTITVTAIKITAKRGSILN